MSENVAVWSLMVYRVGAATASDRDRTLQVVQAAAAEMEGSRDRRRQRPEEVPNAVLLTL